MSRKRHVRYVAVRAHSEASTAEYLRAQLEGGVKAAVVPALNRADRRAKRRGTR